VVVADSMLKDDMREKIESAGIPVLIYVTSEVDTLPKMIEDLGTVLGKKERAKQLIDFYNKYNDLIKERTANLTEKEKPQVYYELNKPYFSTNASGPANHRIELAGGINIAADEPVRSPTLTPEWLAEKNPEIIVRMSSREDSPEQMKELRHEVMSRPGINKTKAVEEDRVYVMKWDVGTGLRSVIGSLYFAKWFQPELFTDIDPEAVHKELLKKFYNLELEGTYVYPDK
ncbi:MAG: ABC transporter substrate-binding protein, partial [Syntrophaceticus sp.]